MSHVLFIDAGTRKPVKILWFAMECEDVWRQNSTLQLLLNTVVSRLDILPIFLQGSSTYAWQPTQLNAGQAVYL